MRFFEEGKIHNDRGKERDGRLFGAFPSCGILTMIFRAPREAGVTDVALRLHADAWNRADAPSILLPLTWVSYAYGYDEYRCEIDLKCLKTNTKSWLFFYRYEVVGADGAFFLGGEEPTTLLCTEAERQLLLYDSAFHTPDFLKQGVLYQIFPDRFCSSGKIDPKPGSVRNPDWEHGVPQYPEKPGDPLENNEFFGGDLYGIVEKLDDLRALGVTCLYLNPVFESPSNHKYDTADYENVDAGFGGDEALKTLFCEAGKRHIAVILDGVFNHTGADSRYFNRYGTYGEGGAFRSKESPYFPWYHFTDYPEEYACWWGVKILPRVQCDDPSYRAYMLGENGVVRRWMRAGAAGFRLDVADELSDAFLAELRQAVRAENPEGIVLGEVWEDASDKIAYGVRKAYLAGNELDSVMNYPLREAVIGFLLHGDAQTLKRTTEGIYRRYPKPVCDVLMNLLGTHDTERILTVLGGVSAEGKTNAELAVLRMTPEEREDGIRKVKLAYVLIATMYGVPCIYYGDEAGMEGYRDPFCRRPYPWGSEQKDLRDLFAAVGALRASEAVLRDGLFYVRAWSPDSFVFVRENSEVRLTVAITREKPLSLAFSAPARCLLGADSGAEARVFAIEPWSACVVRQKIEKNPLTTCCECDIIAKPHRRGL